MKTFFLLLVFMISTFSSFTQSPRDTSNHLTFKGVAIDGTLDEFVLKMKESGFEHIQTENGIAYLQGDFASYKLCYVGVSTLKTKDLVSKIVVLFQDHETWSALSGNYFNLKSLLTEKYGKPSEVVESFQRSIRDNDDNNKMYEVKFDRCKYQTKFESQKGTIMLSIDHEGVSKCFVKLVYIDKLNGETIKKQALDDL